ncbi:hypothetical protein D1632_13255 [Chryseobacterium nematophagum]|uniref:Uncharacterized protein n=1 Tax=Chryseobacterium nematophagum TaxID=2305228 RepID=A0A3M7L8M3_9FLAO|nr:hypothetical protein D1632_13255 [Chryseobacterium nematophagum]
MILYFKNIFQFIHHNLLFFNFELALLLLVMIDVFFLFILNFTEFLIDKREQILYNRVGLEI